MLESVPGTAGRYSVYGWSAADVLTIDRHDPFPTMARAFRPWRIVNTDRPSPFSIGWIGYLAYEAGTFVEPSAGRPIDGRSQPIARWSLYDTLLVHDAARDEWRVIAADLPDDLTSCRRASAARRLDAVERFLETLETLEAERTPVETGAGHARWNMTRRSYESRVARALEYIRAGDVYQVNLAHQCRVAEAGDSFELYDRLCRSNPAAYAAYLSRPRCPGDPGPDCIMSSSPELFIRLRGADVTTRPIKGTRPRGGDASADDRAIRELQQADKDRAELDMIIDLERNDLGRVCQYGSVDVSCAGEIETHPTVFHRTATVSGRLRTDAGGIDLLRAMFPGGSITGAPKVRAMQIIRELESDPRGPYCGAIGYIGLDGDMELNLAIRTMWRRDGVVHLAVGSGIVADSRPDEEYDETLAKARGMFAALGIGPPWGPATVRDQVALLSGPA